MRIKQEQEYMLPTGERIVLRSALSSDATALRRHREIVTSETHFLTRSAEERAREDLCGMIAQFLGEPREFLLCAVAGEEIVGDLMLAHVSDRIKTRHRAYLGISLRQAYCGMGLGTRMIETVAEQAKKNGFLQIELGVYEDNTPAIALYKKMGFREYGRLPNAFRLDDDDYRAELLMVRTL